MTRVFQRLFAAMMASGFVVSNAWAFQAAEDTSADTLQIEQQQIEQLVGQLGAPKFAERQRATQKLLNLGIAAEPALRTAAKGKDAEVRLRAGRILDQISAADFESRLEAFAADIEGKQRHQLPGWARFSEQFGVDETARGLFVEMQRSEPELLGLLESESEALSEAFSRRCEDLSTGPEAYGLVDRGGPSVGTVSALLFVGVSPETKIDEQAAVQLFNLLQPVLQSTAKRGQWLPLLRKMTARWIERDNGPAVAFQNLWLSFNLDFREGLHVAESVVRSESRTADVTPYAILVLAKFGGVEHVPIIEPLLKESVTVVSEENDGGQFETQIRDVALAAVIHLSGKKLPDFGFDASLAGQPILFQPGRYGFANSRKREAAFDRWKQHAAARGTSSGNVDGRAAD
jgi:hypothetical protein